MTANTTIVVTNLVGVVRVPNAALRFKPPATVKKNGQGPTESRRNGEARPSGGGSGSGQGSGGQATGRERQGDKAMRQTLYVLVNDEVKPVRVSPGLTDGSYTEISSGLEPDADVVIGAASGKATTQSSAQVNPFVPQMPRGGGRR